MPADMAPPPVMVDGRRLAAPRVSHIAATFSIDTSTGDGVGRASVEFRGGTVDGFPVLDLRQEVDWVRLDGRPLASDAFAPVDTGAGWEARTRVLDVAVDAGSPHLLEVGYRLGRPDCEGAEAFVCSDGGLRFDLWMSDLHPGRYLESWVPAPLVHDRFALEVELEITGTERAHTAIANTAGIESDRGGRRWRMVYPAHFTALSPMLVVAPADSMEARRSAVGLPGRDRSLGLVVARHTSTEADLGACEGDIGAWLCQLAARYPPWVHGDTFTAVVWSPGRGMEYDGATTASVGALEHEVFHSWFGRGVKPARAADGWIDEAYTTWSTSSRRSELPRFLDEPLGLDEPPVELYPAHPWARHTPTQSYREGARLFAGLAHLLGGPHRLRAAMADWYRSNAGGLITTDGLGAHLRLWSGVDIGPWWARYVHGRDG